MKISITTSFLLIAALSAIMCTPAPLLAKEWIIEPEGEREIVPAQLGPDRQKLDQAQQTLFQGQPGKAAKLLSNWLRKFPNSPLRPEAMYYAGQSLQQDGQLYKAFEQYEQLLERYADSNYFRLSLEAEFDIALKFLSSTKRRALLILKVSADDVGIQILERLPDRWPGSLLAERALVELGDYYIRKKRYADAVYAYDQLVTSYSSSAFVRQARLNAANAYLSMFKGLAFDPVPLIEARERLLQYQELYGSDQQAEQVQAMLAKIDDLQAQRDYQTAKFYQRTGKKPAARFYFQQVVQRWPDSQWAAKSQQRLAKLPPAEKS